MDGERSIYGIREMHTKFQSESLKGRDYSEKLSVDGR
jgi:hypothetical protein